MKTITFIKRFASVLLVIALLLPAFASAQSVKSNDFLKKSKSEQARLRQGVKINPKMAQMRRAVKNPQAIPSSTNLTRQAPAGNAYRAPLAVTESGATLYGNLIYNYNMYDLSQVGFYSINPNTGEYDPVGINSMLAGAGTVVDGIAYVSYADMYYGNILSLYTIIYDVEEGEIIEAVEHSPSDFGSYATNMAYNYVEDAIYAVTYDETGTEYILSKFDRDTKTYIKITDLIVPNDLFAMAFDPEGNLYIIGDDGIVRTLDITTGRTIDVICETGFMPAYMQSACWSPKDKKIIWAASNDYNSYLIAIDVTAGTSETICSFDMYEEWTCLYTTDQIADEDAPAAPAITYTINTPGSTGGSITIQSPTQNIIGETLSSAEYTLVIELNG